LSSPACRVSVRKERNLPGVPSLAVLRRAVESVLALQAFPTAGSISMFFCGDDAIRALNERYRGAARPTDVLSFAGGTVDPEDARLHLGEVVVSVPRARAQARQAGHSLESEIRLLVVHGVLHLLGFDHDTPARKKRMWTAQRSALSALEADSAAGTERRRRQPAPGGPCVPKKRRT
jgi:probable rRNA maturation factor